MQVSSLNDFGAIVRDRRTTLGLSQAELAAQVGNLSRATVNAIENGATNPGLRTILSLVEVLDVRLDVVSRTQTAGDLIRSIRISPNVLPDPSRPT